MEQLSFASVYRTAAILAAFSHASAAGDEADGRAPRPRGADRPRGAIEVAHLGPGLYHIVRNYLRRYRAVQPARSFPSDIARPHGWEAKGYAEIWASMGPHRPRVTSHFAFAEDSERVGLGS